VLSRREAKGDAADQRRAGKPQERRALTKIKRRRDQCDRRGESDMIDSEKVPQLLELTAAISAILGRQWRLLIENWKEAAHISWAPQFRARQIPRRRRFL
jgi:hypothetical protein